MRRLIPRDYRDLNTSESAFDKVLDQSLHRQVTVKPGATLSGILQKEFRVTPSWTPDVYDTFEQRVREINGINDPARDLQAGKPLWLPDMPRGAETLKVGKDKPVTQSVITFGTARNSRVIGVPRVINSVTNTSPTEVQIRTMKPGAYAALKVDPHATREELERSGQYVPVQGRLEAKLAQGEGVAVPLTSAASAKLESLLQRAPATKPYVVVLDDSWPSQADFRHAARFVIDASRLIRTAYSLKDVTHGDSDDIRTLEAEMANGTEFCDANCEYPQLKWHAAMIRKSLEEFQALDKKGLVEVIYLPLNRSQLYSKYVLGEMLRVTQLAESVTQQLVLKTPAGNYPPGVQPGTPNYAQVESDVATIIKAPYLGSAPPAHAPGVELSISTDKAIIDAIVNFMVLYSAASRRPHFVSFSWTTPLNAYPALFRADAYGMWIAAAGNNPAVNIHAEGAQYAARSSTPGDFIAVQNTVSTGCASSKMSDNPGLRVYGLAFPGRFDATHCGTSFSSPRVAWLLALREAIKGTPVMPARTEEWMQWKTIRMNSVYQLTRPALKGEDRYRVDMWQLLDEQPPQ